MESLGSMLRSVLSFLGSIVWLAIDLLQWVWRSIFKKQVRFGRIAFVTQMVRVGVHSTGIVILVSSSIGLILALQTAPSLAQFGQVDKVANLVGVAVFRELGPLIAAIVLKTSRRQFSFEVARMRLEPVAQFSRCARDAR